LLIESNSLTRPFHRRDALDQLRIAGALGPLRQQGHGKLEARDRRAQLVRHRVQQILLRFEQALGTLGHRVHALGQRVDGIGPPHARARGELAGAELVGHARQRLQSLPVRARPQRDRHQQGQRDHHVAHHFHGQGLAEVDRQIAHAQHVRAAADVALTQQVDAPQEAFVRRVEHDLAARQGGLPARGQRGARLRQRYQVEARTRDFAHLVQARQPFVGGSGVDVLFEQEDLGRRLAPRDVVQRIAEQAGKHEVDHEGGARDRQHHQHEKAEEQPVHAAAPPLTPQAMNPCVVFIMVEILMESSLKKPIFTIWRQLLDIHERIALPGSRTIPAHRVFRFPPDAQAQWAFFIRVGAGIWDAAVQARKMLCSQILCLVT
jgi:hypothetical protein